MAEFDSTSSQKILTVTELNRLAREVLQTSFPLFWISGEVSNFTRAASGHWYFSLKDTNAQVRCVMFKGRNNYVDFTPSEGDKIEARATVTLYEARGDFQLTIEFIQKAGLGDLFEAFEKLKQKLQKEGLFDAEAKQTIPEYAKTIGIVTSPDAAALHDVLTTLNRRNPGTGVVIYPTPVQGNGAAKVIASAIQKANERQEVDTLIICRGGGSMEDLWQFNEEVVARAIANCSIPTISAVGHETDFTISDFVADIRAATPTAAAEMACQDFTHLKQKYTNLAQQLNHQIMLTLNQQAQRVDYLSRRLTSPSQKLEVQLSNLQQLSRRIILALQQQLTHQQQQLTRLKASLEQLSPTAVLSRGYAIVSRDKKAITTSKQLQLGETLHVQFKHGDIDVDVVKKY